MAGWAFVGTGSGGGSGTVDVEDEGVAVNSATTLNFVGAGVTATDAGGGTATITIPGGGGGGTPGGSNTQVQFNDGGSFGGDADFTWDSTANELRITGSILVEEGGEIYSDLEGAILFPAQVDETGGITRGQVVHINGVQGTTPTVGLAAADDATKMPAFGLAAGNATDGNAIQIVTFGSLKNINLATLFPAESFSVGDTVYVQTGSGGVSGSLTATPPTGESNFIQNVGKVVRNGGGSDGQIKVTNAGRSNATPNLNKGSLFVGNDSDQAVADNTVFISSSAEQVGINVTSPEAALHVSASSVHTGPAINSFGDVIVTGSVEAVEFTASVGLYVSSSTYQNSFKAQDGVVYNYQSVNRWGILDNYLIRKSVNLYRATSAEQTSNFNIIDEEVFVVNTNSGAVTGTLPNISSDTFIGSTYTIKDIEGSASTNHIRITGSNSQLIDSAVAAEIQVDYGSMTLTAVSRSAGYSWSIVSTNG